MIETPRLKADKETIDANAALCRSFIESISAEADYSDDAKTKAVIWRNIPKRMVIELVRNYVTHPWNLNFQPMALADYISDDDSLDLWDVAIPKGNGPYDPIELKLIDSALSIIPVGRPLKRDPVTANMLKVYDRHVRIGAGGCTKIGLTETETQELRTKYGSSKDSTFLKTKRNPLALIHILKNTNKEPAEGDPDIVFALGLGFPYNGKEKTANYVVNINDLKNWVDITDEDDDGDNQ